MSVQRFEVENFLFFAHAVAVPVCGCGFLCALQKSYFPLAFVFAPDQKAHTYTHRAYSLSGEYMLSNFRMHGVIMSRII